MKRVVSTTGILSFMLMLFFTVGIAQEKKSLGDEVYKEYEAGGIDAALSKYRQLKQDTINYEVSEWVLNNVAYRLMNEKKDMEAAEKLFKLNMEEYPRAANPYDSYGDYLVKKGNKEEAKEYYRKSVELSEVSEDPFEKDQLNANTKGKLAKLENKDRQLDMLVGEWKIDATGYKDGKEVHKMKGVDKIEYKEEANALFFYHRNEQNESEGIRIVAYDAIDDVFDVAYLNPNSLQGIQTSTMKLKPTGKDSFEFTDTYQTRTGKEMVMRHELKKLSDKELDWVIFEKTDDEEWQKVYVMNMKK